MTHRKYRKKLSPILDSVKEQGLDSREFSIEMDVGSNGSGDKAQFAQKISSVFNSFNSMNEQGLKAKEVELEISTGTIHDASQAMQKISAVLNSINSQGFEVKELEVDSEKEE